MRTLLAIFLVMFILGVFPIWPYSAHWGYTPSISLGTVLVVAFIIYLFSNRPIA